jgi:hypothetical protein
MLCYGAWAVEGVSLPAPPPSLPSLPLWPLSLAIVGARTSRVARADDPLLSCAGHPVFGSLKCTLNKNYDVDDYYLYGVRAVRMARTRKMRERNADVHVARALSLPQSTNSLGGTPWYASTGKYVVLSLTGGSVSSKSVRGGASSSGTR